MGGCSSLHVAIFIEQRNARLYEHFARIFEQLPDQESRRTAAALREMAAEEQRHEWPLQERYVQLFRLRACRLTAEDIRELIEEPSLDRGAVPLTEQQVLQATLAAERQARLFYTQLAGLTLEAPLRGLYQEFASFERDHEIDLERKLAALRSRAEVRAVRT